MEMYREFTHSCVDLVAERSVGGQDSVVQASKAYALGVFSGDLTPGQVAQRLADWNRTNRQMCSELFEDVMRQRLDAGESGLLADIRRDEQLMMLNGIRRGVKAAMRSSQCAAEERNRSILLSQRSAGYRPNKEDLVS